jgi:acetyl-CoA acetyltransferase
MPTTKNRIAIVGCGYTDVTRQPTKSLTELGVEACRAAAADAGLDVTLVDGINIQLHHDDPPIAEIRAGLGLGEIRWENAGGIGVSAAVRSAQALDNELCDYVLVCKIMDTLAPIATPQIDPESGRVAGQAQFEVPYGLGYSMQRIGLVARRWMNRYGIREDQVGSLCVAQRANALLNPRAMFRSPLTLDEYLASRWICEPVRLLDCDYPVNGARAYLMTREDRARELQHRPVFLESWVERDITIYEWYLAQEDLAPSPAEWIRPLYRDAGIGPKDLDVWMLYDGFSFFALQWMEELGLVPRGEAGNYVEGGQRIRYDGEHPLNPHGGQLSEGRLHGSGHILEAVQQLRGAAGARQGHEVDRAVVTTAITFGGAAAIFGID